MENEESLDSPFNFFQNNMPYNEDTNKRKEDLIYSQIFNSRDSFIISGISRNKIIITKQSLNKIASMIEIFPEDYITFTDDGESTFTSFYLFRKLNNNIIVDEKVENTDNIINEDNEDNNDLDDDGFKKVENLEDNLFDPEVYKRSFCFYLFLIFCSIWDFLFYIYIITFTEYKTNFFTIYTLILSLLSFFTGIFGLLKSKNKDFSGYILKTFTILVPILVIIGIIIYSSGDIEFDLYWVKIIIDVLTIAISLILISFVTGLIKAEIIFFNNNAQINQNLIIDGNNETIEQNEHTPKF